MEVRTTISPLPHFFRRIHFLAASLRALGGELANHEIVVSVGGGDYENYYETQPWSNAYPLTWRRVPPDAYARLGYRATNRDRAAHVARAEFVMMVDADVIVLRDFSSLLAELRAEPAIVGVMAHISPFKVMTLKPDAAERMGADRSDAACWRLLADHFGVPELRLDQQYSGWGFMDTESDRRLGPHYFNGGMVLGPRALMEKMCAYYTEAEEAVDALMDNYSRPQLARTLACAKAGAPCRSLPARYNFPNDPVFEQFHSDEARDIAVLHYLRHDVVHRDRDFTDRDAVDRLVARADLTGSNEELRRRVAELRQRVFALEKHAISW
ncbi:MAG: glycosyltransferase family A protein [Pseudomonadota bacterium]